MANEKRLIPFGEKVTLYDLPFGAMFAFGDDCIAVKSEYTCGNGLIESFILGSGEQFWGSAKTAKEQNELMVQPLEIVDVDAVEVVRIEEVKKEILQGFDVLIEEYQHISQSSMDYFGIKAEAMEIARRLVNAALNDLYPNCGAKMDGGNEDV